MTAEHKNHSELLAQAFADSLSEVPDPRERDRLSRLLARPGERITQDVVLDEAMLAGTDWLSLHKLQGAFENVGFPEDDEPIEFAILSPAQIKAVLSQGDHTEFSNEFTLFVYASGKIPGEALETVTPTCMVAQYNPALLRLRTLAPGLVESMEAYGAKHRPMSEFYGGLVQDTPESRKYLTLFTVADQLLQRLVRPGDMEYIAECIRRAAVVKFGDYKPPRYDELTPTRENIVKNARNFLRG